MKLLLLSDANSVHTFKWAIALKNRKVDLLVFSILKPNNDFNYKYKQNGIDVISSNLNIKLNKLREPSFRKINYLSCLPLLKKTIKNFNPDIVHAHYASSYGFLALFCKYRPIILSVWGSDIYFFPYKNKIFKSLMKFVIRHPDVICSTSSTMKDLIEKDYMRYDVNVVPFGIDLKIFKPNRNKNFKFTVGTIKSIENHNGLDCLIDAANIIINKYDLDIKFLIVGDGSLKNKMQDKAKNLKIEKNIEFVGSVKHEKVPKYYDLMSIFVAVSTRESFGVSVLEAAACEIPSITSNVGGLPEVNLHGKTGFVLNPNEPHRLAKSI